MTNPLSPTMGDYYRSTGTGHIALGFQPANPITFDINFFVLSGLRVK